MSMIDHFRAYTNSGRKIAVVVTASTDDCTWFEMYANGQILGKLHWRADLDGYIAISPSGSACGSSSVLSEAEDLLVQEAGYYNTIPMMEAQR